MLKHIKKYKIGIEESTGFLCSFQSMMTHF